jgi:hypothetical protein
MAKSFYYLIGLLPTQLQHVVVGFARRKHKQGNPKNIKTCTTYQKANNKMQVYDVHHNNFCEAILRRESHKKEL